MTWKEELTKQADKYHTVGAWVAIILNPIWAIGDYFEIPAYWKQFFVIRLLVAGISFVVLISKSRFSIKPEWLIYFPFLGIAIQNAYMYSVMPVEIIQKHTFAYIALFIGAGMLVLWKPIYTISIVVLNVIANIIFFYFDSNLSIGEVLINGGMLTFTVSIFTILLIHTRFNLTKKEIIARLSLEEAKKEIEHAHNEVKASINYAERIQKALLDNKEYWDSISEHFILFRPRDVVSGDFYWAYSFQGHTPNPSQEGNLCIWAAADCTGHGVPGAFMSMLGVSFLNEIVVEGGETNPGRILDKLRAKIIKTLEQKSSDEERKDGMDIALCVWNKQTNILQFAGANNPLVIVRGDEMIEQKADKMPIGKYVNNEKPFTTHEIQLQKGDTIYTFTDGFQDQFGGAEGKKYMVKRMKNYLSGMNEVPLYRQRELLNEEFVQWMKIGKTNQIDDICIIGVRI